MIAENSSPSHRIPRKRTKQKGERGEGWIGTDLLATLTLSGRLIWFRKKTRPFVRTNNFIVWSPTRRPIAVERFEGLASKWYPHREFRRNAKVRPASLLACMLAIGPRNGSHIISGVLAGLGGFVKRGNSVNKGTLLDPLETYLQARSPTSGR